VDWQTVTVLGACGGALVTVVAFSADVTSWQRARRVARAKGERELPSLAAFVDLPADSLSLATRMALGALAGLLFRAQVSGAQAAIAVGAAAPALLTQFVTDHPPKLDEALWEPHRGAPRQS
jgi:hypothetical protein